MATNPDDYDFVVFKFKMCPICVRGIIGFEDDSVGAHGECNNQKNHEDKYGHFEITRMEPFTVNYIQEPLNSYTMPANIPHVITEEGIKFSVRDATDLDNIRDAILRSCEGLTDWLQHGLIESMEWDGVDWDEYEEVDNGITEYILENTE